jgi:hypothetical protein
LGEKKIGNFNFFSRVNFFSTNFVNSWDLFIYFSYHKIEKEKEKENTLVPTSC